MNSPSRPTSSARALRPPHRTPAGGLFFAFAALLLLLPVAASGVVISTGDGTGNTTPPVGDPGFANVGVVNGLSGVYVRNGWVLTANHVGVHPITLDGVTYQPIIGSDIRFQNPDASFADLRAYKLTERPPLPDLLITDGAIAQNTLITIIGNGRSRGAATSWMGVNGWEWASPSVLRWGTNRVGEINQLTLGTQSFWTYFDASSPGGQHEADIVTGDSGGAAFIGSGASAELVGILFARGAFNGQPANTSLFGNAGFVVDLFQYRSDILAVIDQPDCDDGLDDDGDGLVDYPADPGCTSATDTDEQEQTLDCDNGIDDDLDGTIDLEDGGCSAPSDTSERGAAWQCDNGIDDDLDQQTDFPNDPGCLHPTGLYELPEPGLGLGLAFGVLGMASSRRRRGGVSPR